MTAGKCSARVWPVGSWHPHRCSNTATGERQTWPLCKTHMNVYDRGRFVDVIVADTPSDRHFGRDLKTEKISKPREVNQ